jgi:hypothetical protein
MRRIFGTRRLWMLAATCAVLGAAIAEASPTTYTSQAAFLTALGGPSQTLDFDTLAAGTLIPSGTAQGGITFTYSLGARQLQVRNDFGTTSSPNYLGLTSIDGTFLNGESFTMDFASPITALGLYVIGAPDANIAGDFSLVASGSGGLANGAVPDRFLADGDAYFLGIIDPAGFNEAVLLSSTVNCDPGQDCQFVWNVDDITTRQAETAVPEPPALLLLLPGMAGLVRFARRGRRG